MGSLLCWEQVSMGAYSLEDASVQYARASRGQYIDCTHPPCCHVGPDNQQQAPDVVCRHEPACRQLAAQGAARPVSFPCLRCGRKP